MSKRCDTLYGPVGFWFLNDELTEDVIDAQLDHFSQQGFSGVVLHPRDGMTTPYLSHQWFEAVKYIVKGCVNRGLEPWFYDEAPYPSGTAGGHLLNNYPHLAAQQLAFSSETVKPKDGFIRVGVGSKGRLLKLYASDLSDGDGSEGPFEDITRHAGLIGTEWYVAREQSQGYGPLFSDNTCEPHWRAFQSGDTWVLNWRTGDSKERMIIAVWIAGAQDTRHGQYVDLLNPETTERFIELTHQATLDYLGDETFSHFAAVFTDEARLCGPYPWTSSLPKDYQTFYHENLFEVLPLLQLGTGPKSQRTRYRYRRLLGKLFCERFIGQLAKWCTEHGLPLTGHFSPEEDPMNQPSITPCWARLTGAMHWPGCDQITSLFGIAPNEHWSLGPKLTSSLAHQNGLPHVMAETLGVSGEGLTIQRMRKILDWLAICGADKFVFHGQFMSLDGHRKREAPPSIFYQAPYWKHMHCLSEYLSKISEWMTSSVPDRPIAVLYPSAAFEAWMPVQTAEAAVLARHIGRLLGKMMAAGLDFDIIADNDLIKAEVITKSNGTEFKIGCASYQTLVVPDVPLLDKPSSAALNYLKNGGVMIHSLASESHVIGEEMLCHVFSNSYSHIDTLVRHLALHYRQWVNFPEDHDLFVNSRRANGLMTRLVWNPSDCPINLSLSKSTNIDIASPDGLKPISAIRTPAGGLTIELEPWQTLILNENLPAPVTKTIEVSTLEDTDVEWLEDWTLKPNEPNVLVLSQWHLEIADGTHRLVHLPIGNDVLPWDVDEQTAIGNDVLPCVSAGQGTKAWCEVAIDSIPDTPQLWWDRSTFDSEYQLFINGKAIGKPASASKRDLHERYVRLDGFLCEGINRFEVHISPLQSHRLAILDPLRLTGWFKVEHVGGNHLPSKICGIDKAIYINKPGDWTALGFPHYSGTMCYATSFNINNIPKLCYVERPSPQLDAFEVAINGVSVGERCWRPFRVEITELLKAGKNTIEISVSNSSINRTEGKPQPSGLLGPIEIKSLIVGKQEQAHVKRDAGQHNNCRVALIEKT